MVANDHRVYVYDTTLRDGEQSPGASMNPDEKLLLAVQLEKLGVDVIEAGFPICSTEDFRAVQMIAKRVREVQVAALARANPRDIDCAWEALREAACPRLNVFLAASDIHLRHQLKKSRSEVIELAVASLVHARHYTKNLEFSAMDAGRAERTFLKELFEAAIAVGAKIVNVPDTVGYSVPEELGDLFRYLLAETKGIDKVILSVHCHDDLGLATANTLAAVKNGARQVKCTMNGIGERAGNAALEEVVMALATRENFYGFKTRIRTEKLFYTSQLLSRIIKMPVPPNKSIVGANAFVHESGIHQDGLLKERSTYEIMTPQSVGASECNLVLGRHSGSHAVKHALMGMGYTPTEEEVALAVQRFKQRASGCKNIGREDLEEIFCQEVRHKEPWPIKSKRNRKKENASCKKRN